MTTTATPAASYRVIMIVCYTVSQQHLASLLFQFTLKHIMQSAYAHHLRNDNCRRVVMCVRNNALLLFVPEH